jgi:hypothetical protein
MRGEIETCLMLCELDEVRCGCLDRPLYLLLCSTNTFGFGDPVTHNLVV